MTSFRSGNIIKFSILLIISLITLLAGCGDTQQDERAKEQEKVINFGSYDAKDGVYTNEYFNLKVKIPESWSVMNDKDREAMMLNAGNIIAGDNGNLKKELNAQALQNLVLFVASESPMGAAVDSNPNFQIGAQSLTGLPGVKTGSDIHFHTKKLLSTADLEITYPTDIYQKQVSGVTFDVLELDMMKGNQRVLQRQYATVIQGYGLMFALTYQVPEDLPKLEGIVENISLN